MGDFRHRCPLLGRHGAAGLLLRALRADGALAVLLQHRAPWSHQGGTWGLPGGARDSHETPEQAAVREANEEAGLVADQVIVRISVVTAEVGSDAGGASWSYTTVIADAPELLETVPNRESSELRWVAEDEVADLPLHPGIRRELAAVARGDRDYSAVPLVPADSAATRRAAAAPGSLAPVIARTTTTLVAPASITSGSRCSSIPPIANHGFVLLGHRRRCPDQVQAGGRATRLGRRRPARPDTEIADISSLNRRLRPRRSRAWSARSPAGHR